MLGMVIGGSILLVLIALALANVLRFRVAVGYAWAARKAMIPVVLGLSTITAVLGAAAIIEDSAVQGVRDSFVSPFHAVDGYIGSWGDRGIDDASLQEFLDHPDMAAILDDTSVRTAQLAAEGPTGLGGVRQDVWVIEPGDYSAFVDFQVIDGAVPSSWGSRDVVLDERAAVVYGVTAGDKITTYIGAALVPFINQEEVEGSYPVITPAQGVVGFTDPVAGTDSDRRLLASFEAQRDDRIVVAVQIDGANVNLDPEDYTLAYFVDAPGEEIDGNYGLNDEENPRWTFGVDAEHEGTWDIYIEPFGANIATDVSYSGNVRHEGFRLPDARVETLTVRAIVADSGTPLQDRDTVLVGPAAKDILFDTVPPVNGVFLDIADDVDHEQFQADMERAADQAFERGGVFAWDVQYEVQQLTEEIELAVGPTFVAFGSLSIGAGIVLVIVLVNIIVEERRRVLGTLRAVGATQGQVQTMVLHELALVAMASVLLGVLFATALAGGIQGLIQALLVNESESLTFVVRASAVFDAAGWAFTLILASAWFGARRALRASPNELLRDHPDPPSKRAWIGRILVIVFAALLGIPLVLWAPPGFAVLIAGSAVVIAAAWAVSKFIKFPYLVDIVLIGLVIAISITMFTQQPDNEVEVLLFPIQGLMLVGMGATLLVRSKLVHLGMVAFLSGPLRTMGEMATGNLRDRPARQTAILSVLAVSILMITAMSMMFQTFSPVATDDGGFSVVGQTPVVMSSPAEYYEDNPPRSGADPFALADVVLKVPYTYRWDDFGIVEQNGASDYVRGGFSWSQFNVGLRLSNQLANGFEFEAVELAPGVVDWDDAVRRVQADSNAVILSGAVRYWVPDVSDPDRSGDYESVTFDMDLVDRETRAPIEVVAIVPGASNWAALLGQERFDEAAGVDYDHLYFFKPKEGVSSADLAASVGSAFRSAGMAVTDMDEEAREERRVEITIQTILGLFMGLGILVGMLSLALIAQRTYQQRRGSLAILRAIGASRERVMAAFVVEQVFVVVLAVLLGVVVGIMMAGSMILAFDEGYTVQVNAAFLAGVLGATILGGVLVGLMPALKIRRMKLAEALRYES